MALPTAPHTDRPAHRRPAPRAVVAPTHALVPALLEALLRALLTTLLGRPARARHHTSWQYLPTVPHNHATTTTLPRPLRRGSPDILIARAHAGPRRRVRPRPGPPHAPPTTARGPPPYHPHHTTPQTKNAPKRERLRTGLLLRFRN